jgi:hypothetical protein
MTPSAALPTASLSTFLDQAINHKQQHRAGNGADA